MKNNVRFKSNYNQVLNSLDKLMLQRMEQACLHLQNEVKQTLTGQRHGRRYIVPGLKTIRERIGNKKNKIIAKKEETLGRALTEEEKAMIRPALSKKQRAKRYYVASAPGEAPAAPTGQLRNSIKYKIVGTSIKDLRGIVGSPLEKAIWLEFGTLKMARRPFFKVTYEKEKATIQQILKGNRL